MGWLHCLVPLGQDAMCWTWQMSQKARFHTEFASENEKKSLELVLWKGSLSYNLGRCWIQDH